MKSLKPWLVSTTLLLFVFSCMKETSKETPKNTPGNGGNNGGNENIDWGWSFKGEGAGYHGCIDTAYYETVNGFKVLNIDGIDSADNSWSIVLANATKTGTYTTAQGAIMMFEDKDGNMFMPTTANAVTATISAINDTSITATFSATLNNPVGSGSFKITDGKLKAKIGKENPCH